MTDAQDAPLNVRCNAHGKPVRSVAHTIAGARSMIRNVARRAAHHQEVDLPDLAALLALRDEVDAALVDTIAVLRDQGASWTDVGNALGMTRQGARQRFDRPA